jgi:intein-encoded DNA endonuclease-like protein
MARQEEAVKKLKEDVLELRSQNVSQSSSVTNLADTSTLRIG